MAIPTSMADLSATPASNSPAGTDAIGTTLDDFLRAVQAIVKQDVSSGVDIASAGTIAIPSAGGYFQITGTTAITAISDSWTGRVVVVRFAGVLTLTNGAGLVIPGGANITTAAGDHCQLVNSAAGVWRVANYVKAASLFATISGTETLTNKTIDLANNTLAGTIAQFNAALSGADFATLAGVESLTNKTINLASNTITGTKSLFDTALSDDNFAYLATANVFTAKQALGTANSTQTQFRNSLSLTGNATQFANYADGTIASDVTGNARMYYSLTSTAAASFTVSAVFGYQAAQGTIGAGSAITSQYGFHADSTLIGATNNYGFYSDIASGTGRFNFHAAGTANNFAAGPWLIGANSRLSGELLRVSNGVSGASINASTNVIIEDDTQPILTMAGSSTASIFFADAGSALAGYIQYDHGSDFLRFGTATAEAARFSSSQNFGVGVTNPTSKIHTTSLAASLVTNTAATYTVLTSDHTIIQTTAASVYTLPAAASFPGRRLHISTQFAGTVTSASSNVVPIAGGAAGTAILAATAGKFAILQSNGTNWVIMAAN